MCNETAMKMAMKDEKWGSISIFLPKLQDVISLTKKWHVMSSSSILLIQCSINTQSIVCEIKDM